MTLYYFLCQHLPNILVDSLLVTGIVVALGSCLWTLWFLGKHFFLAATGHGVHRQSGNPADRRSIRHLHLTPVASRPSMEETFVYDWAKVGDDR